MKLDLSPFKKAFLSLVKAVDRARNHPEDLELRDACIQRFEYTYDLSIKFLKRYLDIESAVSEKIDHLNYRDLLRLAGENGLIETVELWFQFREARNKTSHAYDELKAQEVFDVIPIFIQHVRFFLDTLEHRIPLP